MEPEHLRRYLHLMKQCIDMTTEIHPYFQKMYPDGVKVMIALYLLLLDAPTAVEQQQIACQIEWCKESIESLQKMKIYLSSSETGNS